MAQSMEQRFANGRILFDLICEQEGDHAVAAHRAAHPRATKAALEAVAEKHRAAHGGKALRSDRIGVYNLSRTGLYPTLQATLDDLFGITPLTMLRALVQPTHALFMQRLQAEQEVHSVFAPLGMTKNQTELIYLNRIPEEGDGVDGGPGSRR